MLYQPNHRLLKPFFILTNVLNGMFLIFFLIPYPVDSSLNRSWWMWTLWGTCLAWVTAMIFVFPFSRRFRDRLTSVIPTNLIFAISAALTLLFLHLK